MLINLTFDEYKYIKLQMNFVITVHISVQAAAYRARPTGNLKHLFLHQVFGLPPLKN